MICVLCLCVCVFARVRAQCWYSGVQVQQYVFLQHVCGQMCVCMWCLDCVALFVCVCVRRCVSITHSNRSDGEIHREKEREVIAISW